MNGIQDIEKQLKKLNIAINEDQKLKIEKYVDLLFKWNKAYNLVGKTTLDSAYSRHVLDSIQLMNFIKEDVKKQGNILDFGAGAGMPSVLLAIMLPGAKITACERVGKKCQFLNQVRRELALTNFKVDNGDVKDLDGSFDLITCRAVADISTILELTKGLVVNKQGYLLPKGRNYNIEIESALGKGFEFEYTCSDSIVDEESFILELQV